MIRSNNPRSHARKLPTPCTVPRQRHKCGVRLRHRSWWHCFAHLYTSNGTGSLGLAFTEASTWIGEWSDASNGKFQGRDGAIYANITAGPGTYKMPDKVMRGGFCYMTAFLTTTTGAWLNVTDMQLEINFQPTWANLRAYQGYFHCDDELLNRIWYAGAYTLQTNAVPTNTGRWVPC